MLSSCQSVRWRHQIALYVLTTQITKCHVKFVLSHEKMMQMRKLIGHREVLFFCLFVFLHMNENFDMWNSHFHMWITYTHTYLAFFHMWVRIYIYGNKTWHMKSHTVCTCEYHIFLKFDVPFAIFTCELTYANWAFSQSTILKGLQSEFHTWKISFKSVKKKQ